MEAHEEFLRHLEREQSIAFLSALPPGSAAVLGPLESQGRGFMHPHAISASQPAVTTPAVLMQAVRALGRYPKEVDGAAEEKEQERALGYKLRYARRAAKFTPEQLAELDGLKGVAPQPTVTTPEQLMQEVRNLGRYNGRY